MAHTYEGPHVGRGPKGYRRSDARICEDVNDLIARHGYIDARDVEIRVENGDVFLEGSVAQRDDRREIENIAEGVSGVVDVINRLRVRRG